MRPHRHRPQAREPYRTESDRDELVRSKSLGTDSGWHEAWPSDVDRRDVPRHDRGRRQGSTCAGHLLKPGDRLRPLSLGQSRRLGDWNVKVTSLQADRGSNARAVAEFNQPPGTDTYTPSCNSRPRMRAPGAACPTISKYPSMASPNTTRTTRAWVRRISATRSCSPASRRRARNASTCSPPRRPEAWLKLPSQTQYLTRTDLARIGRLGSCRQGDNAMFHRGKYARWLRVAERELGQPPPPPGVSVGRSDSS